MLETMEIGSVKTGCICIYINGHRTRTAEDCPVHDTAKFGVTVIAPRQTLAKCRFCQKTQNANEIHFCEVNVKKKKAEVFNMPESPICKCTFVNGVRVKLNFNCEVCAPQK